MAELADVMVAAGDFTNHGMPAEMCGVLGVVTNIHLTAENHERDERQFSGRLGSNPRLLP
jgi:3',5'-cyclic AMP phosphodiesterase CpdA